MRNRLLFLLLFFCAGMLKAQIAVTPSTGRTAYDLVSSVLVGGGVSVSNVTFNNVAVTLNATTGAQIGTFTNNVSGFPAFPFSNGLILTTGDVSVANGPNDTESACSPVYNSVTCTELENLISAWGDLYNPAVLEFDFVTLGNSVNFNYVFASEEYPDYVGSNFNDVFGFFVTDMVTNVMTNIALIPGTSSPVTINNVNFSSYSQYYHTIGDYAQSMQYNAFVGPFTATMSVVPCRTYHMKLAISNVSDERYDSAVMFQAQSFTANAISANVTYDNPSLPLVVYGCNNALLTFSMPAPLAYDTTLTLTIGGTAVNGTDIQQIPSQVTIRAGQTSATIPIVALPGNSSDTLHLIISYQTSICANAQSVFQYEVLILNDNKIDIAAHDIISCSRVDSIGVDLVAGEIGTLQWLPANNLSNPHDLTTGFITPAEGETSYTVIATDKYNCMSDTAHFLFRQGTTTVDTIQASICEGDEFTMNGVTLTSPGCHAIVISSAWGCDSTIVVDLTVHPMKVTINKLTEDFCENFSMDLEAVTENENLQWSTGETTAQITVNRPGVYTATVSDEICSATAHVEIAGCPFKLIIPNSFSPYPADGVNDYFYLPNLNPDMVQSFAIYIYDRWGKLAFSSDDPAFHWDGTVDGKLARQQVFSYRIDLKTYYQESVQYKGHITVL